MMHQTQSSFVYPYTNTSIFSHKRAQQGSYHAITAVDIGYVIVMGLPSTLFVVMACWKSFTILTLKVLNF